MSDDKPLYSIAAAWASFERNVLADVGAVPRNEMRRAFYAGASGLFFSVLGVLERGKNATEGDSVKVDDLHQEITRFRADLNKGRA
jgi:hypothetical protein